MVSFPHRPTSGALATIGRRIVEGALTAWAAVSVAFFALRIVSGDPVDSLLSQGLATAEQADRLRKMLGLDVSLPVQYLHFLRDFFRGDLGVSLYDGRGVSSVVAQQFPATAQLALTGLGFAILFGFILGITSAWKARSPVGRIASNLAGLATSLPVAFTGILALLGFHYLLQLIPAMQIATLRRLILPALVLGFSSAGAIARVIQASLSESMQEPYMLAARARGIRGEARLLWHALKPALPPAISLSALEAAFLFAGTVVTETVFSRPGLGRLLVNSILIGDYPIAQGVVVLAAVIYTVSHVVADITALMVDPRLRRVS